MPQISYKLQNWLLVALITLVWGSSFMLMKRGLVVFAPQQVAAARLFLGGLVVIPLYYRHYAAIPVRKLPYIALIAFCGNGIPPFLFTAAQAHLDSSITGILNSTTPLFTLLTGVAAFGLSVDRRRAWGVLVGLGGAVFLVLNNGNNAADSNYQYGLLIILATFLYSISANVVKRYCQDIPPAVINLAAFSMLVLPSGVLLWYSQFVSAALSHVGSSKAVGAIVVLAVVNTVWANLLFYRLTQRTDAIFASTITYLIPIVAVGWGMYDGEQITWQYIVGTIIILAGVYLTQKTTSTAANKPTV